MAILRRLLLSCGALVALSACHADGPTHSVTTTADTVDSNPGDGACADAAGECSLRAAVMEANAVPGVDWIRLGAGPYVLSIPGAAEDDPALGDLDITDSVVIGGQALVDAGALDRAFDIDAAGLTELRDMTIIHGQADGAAIRARTGSTLLFGVTLTGPPGGGPAPSVLAASDTGLDVSGSTFAGNDTTSLVTVDGGGLLMENTTVSGTGTGVGVAITNTTNARIIHTTFADLATAIDGAATLRSSVIDNIANGCTGAVISLGGNIESSDLCGLTGPGDVTATDPQLGPLRDNGGPVLTRHPLGASPAIDGANASACTTFDIDARLIARPVDASCDAGAVEVERGSACGFDPPDVPFPDYSYCNLAGERVWAFARFTGGSFVGAELVGDSFAGPMVDADFTNATLSGVTSFTSFFANATLDGMDFSGASLGDSSADGASFVGASFANAQMNNTTYARVDMTSANLDGVEFSDTFFTDARFDGATMTNADFYSSLFIGASLVGADLSNSFFDADFTGADLTGATTTGASFAGADWADTTCPDGTNSDNNGGTCEGHL